MIEQTCKDCLYYHYYRKDEYGGNIGWCRYNPPVVGDTYSCFPLVKETSWCGKFTYGD
jgi:hypothetical protein